MRALRENVRMNREQAIDGAQISANQTGERWYAVRIKHIGEQELEETLSETSKEELGDWIAHWDNRERDEWMYCNEATAGTYIRGEKKICVYPVSVSKNRQYGVAKGGHIGAGSAKHR